MANHSKVVVVPEHWLGWKIMEKIIDIGCEGFKTKATWGLFASSPPAGVLLRFAMSQSIDLLPSSMVASRVWRPSGLEKRVKKAKNLEGVEGSCFCIKPTKKTPQVPDGH